MKATSRKRPKLFLPTTAHKLFLNITSVVRVSRPQVFAAFASAEELKKWFGPGGCHVTNGEMDFRPGGTYRLGIHTTDFGQASLIGTYQEIVPNERIQFTWSWRDNSAMEPWGEMLVTVQFADHADGTQLIITHEGLVNQQVRDGHSHGWTGSIDKLAGYFGASCRN